MQYYEATASIAVALVAPGHHPVPGETAGLLLASSVRMAGHAVHRLVVHTGVFELCQ